MKSSRSLAAYMILATVPGNTYSHVSESGYVLLLPTEMYVNSGLFAVGATMLILSVLPVGIMSYWSMQLQLTSSLKIPTTAFRAQLLVVTAFLFLLGAGYLGNSDPLKNALPLFFWTVFWVGIVLMQGVVGNVWTTLNPWACFHRLIYRHDHHYFQLPSRIEAWPAALLYLGFFTFYLADIAPDNPTRLAKLLSLYSIMTIAGIFIFGRKAWLHQCEFISVFMRLFSLLSPLGRREGALYIGYPGWQIIIKKEISISLSIISLLMLGSGSFDGINETFWWLHINDMNPLAYQGRSSTVVHNITGLIVFNLALILFFALCVKLGQLLTLRWGINHISQQVTFKPYFSCMAITVLPIAFAYHYAHFLTAFLLDIQYVSQLTLSPWQLVQSYLDPVTLSAAEPHHVTGGFLADHKTVKTLWLSQCIAVVLGHILSALLAHSIAVRFYRNRQNAFLAQLPITIFMLAYTYLGLWLLASARI